VFENCNLDGVDLTGTSIVGTRFDNCSIHGTKLDMNGFLQYGISKGFVLG